MLDLNKLTATLIDPDDTCSSLPDITVHAATNGYRLAQVTCYAYDVDTITSILGTPADIQYGQKPDRLVLIDYHHNPHCDPLERMAKIRAALSGIYTYAWTKLCYTDSEDPGKPERKVVCYPEGTAVGVVVAKEDADAHTPLATRWWRERLIEQQPLRYRWSADGQLELIVWLTPDARRTLLATCRLLVRLAFD